MKVDIYMAGDSRRPDTIERWVGYLIRAGRGEVTGTASCVDTFHGSFLPVIVDALDRFIRPAEITMHIEDGWVAACLARMEEGEEGDPRSLLERWQANGWKKSNGSPIDNKDKWQRVYNKLRVFENSGGTFQFVKLEKNDETDASCMAKIARAIKSSKQNPD